MDTKFWKNIVSSCFLIIFCIQTGFADNVRLKIEKTTVNNLDKSRWRNHIESNTMSIKHAFKGNRFKRYVREMKCIFNIL